MSLVTNYLSEMVGQVVLIPSLRRVIGEGPVNEFFDRADESSVIVDCIVVVGRP